MHDWAKYPCWDGIHIQSFHGQILQPGWNTLTGLPWTLSICTPLSVGVFDIYGLRETHQGANTHVRDKSLRWYCLAFRPPLYVVRIAAAAPAPYRRQIISNHRRDLTATIRSHGSLSRYMPWRSANFFLCYSRFGIFATTITSCMIPDRVIQWIPCFQIHCGVIITLSFSPKYLQHTPHSSPVRARYRLAIQRLIYVLLL